MVAEAGVLARNTLAVSTVRPDHPELHPVLAEIGDLERRGVTKERLGPARVGVGHDGEVETRAPFHEIERKRGGLHERAVHVVEIEQRAVANLPRGEVRDHGPSPGGRAGGPQRQAARAPFWIKPGVWTERPPARGRLALSDERGTRRPCLRERHARRAGDESAVMGEAQLVRASRQLDPGTPVIQAVVIRGLDVSATGSVPCLEGQLEDFPTVGILDDQAGALAVVGVQTERVHPRVERVAGEILTNRFTAGRRLQLEHHDVMRPGDERGASGEIALVEHRGLHLSPRGRAREHTTEQDAHQHRADRAVHGTLYRVHGNTVNGATDQVLLVGSLLSEDRQKEADDHVRGARRTTPTSPSCPLGRQSSRAVSIEELCRAR